MVQRTGFFSTCYLVQLVVADVESDELDLVSESWLCGGMGEGHDNVDDGHDLVLDIYDQVDNNTYSGVGEGVEGHDYVDGDHELVLDIYDHVDFDT